MVLHLIRPCIASGDNRAFSLHVLRHAWNWISLISTGCGLADC